MKVGNYSANNYLEKLHEEAENKEGNTEKGYNMSEVPGLVLPEDTKKNFDWLNKEYQNGKTEVKIEIKGEGSSFKPGFELETKLDTVKDFKPGMYGDVKTSDGGLSKETKPKSPENKKETTEAEDTEPKDAKEAKDDKEQSVGKKPAEQQMKVDISKKKDNDK